MRSASAWACRTPSTTSQPGMIGTPASRMVRRAASLSPIFSMISASGPMKPRPHSLHRAANLGFSESRPYPGWMASQPVSTAAETMALMLR